MGHKSKKTKEEEDEEVKGETMINKIYKRIEGEIKDPMFHVRMLTAVRGSLAVLVPTMLIYSDWCLAHFPTIAIVLSSHYLISHMVQSLTGVIAIAVQSFKGGIVGCFFGYLAYLAAPHLAVKLVYLFIFTITLGLWDPYLKQGIFVKWAIVDFFIILFTPQTFAPHSVLYGAGILYAVAHGFSFAVSIITSLLFWPNLSSFEFAREFRLSLQMCNEVFKLISFRIDRDVIKEGKKGHTQLGTTQELEAILHVHGLPDEDIKDFEHQLSVKLIRLRRLMADSKAETWNPKIPDYEKLLDHMNNLYHQLKNIHSAMNSAKFSGLIHHTYLAPMLPFMESLQRNIIAHFESLLSPTPPPSPNAARVVRHEVVSKVLEVVDFDETVRTLDTAYRARVHDFESSETGNLPLPSREVTRLVYIIFGFVEFAHVLRDLEAIAARIGMDRRSRYGVIWEDVVFHFNLFPSANPITFVKEMIAKAKVMYKDFRQLTWRSAWNSPMWRFPIRLSCGLTAITLVLFSIPSKHTTQDIFPYYTPLWACLTYVVVVLPSLGATVRKSVHRFGGTIVGAFMGHVFLLAVLAIHHHYGQAFVHIILQFLYFLPIFFLQQVPMFGYSSTVAGLTYLTIFIGQYRNQNGDIIYACMRAFFILIGVTWAFIIGTFFFPSKSSIVYTKTLVDTISKIGSLFGDVIDRGMEMTPENEDNLKKEEEINSAIKTIHSNYLLMRSNLKEAKSELIFTWSGYKGFKDTLHQAHRAYYTLASMITILGHKGFSPELGELIGFMNSHFRHLVTPIVASAHRVEDVFHKRNLRTSECQSSAATMLRTIDQQYYLFRKAKIEQRTLGDLHPAIRQFTTYLYLVREFVMEWRVMIETVNAFFNINIEIFPIIFLEDSSIDSSTIVSPVSTPATLSPITHSPEIHLLQVNGGETETNCTRE